MSQNFYVTQKQFHQLSTDRKIILEEYNSANQEFF